MRFLKESEWDLPVEERKMKFYTDPGAYNPERATPILGLYMCPMSRRFHGPVYF